MKVRLLPALNIILALLFFILKLIQVEILVLVSVYAVYWAVQYSRVKPEEQKKIIWVGFIILTVICVASFVNYIQ